MTLTLRNLSIIGFIICAVSLGAAHYLEYEYMISPCPMCMLQRLVFWALGSVFLLGAIFNFKSWVRYAYSLVIMLLSGIGFTIATRQFWLQHFAPPQTVSCSASLERLIDLYPFLDALKMALTGSSECATIDFTIFTISIAGWSVFLFGSLIIVSCYVLYLQKKGRI
jgi:disulfide bond formation protein DsbB